jgi:predicted transcriptional regulator
MGQHREHAMKTIHIGVATSGNVKVRAKAAFSGTPQGEYISFASLDLMHRVLTPNRWGVLKAMMGRGEMGVRELARTLERDVKAVHTDVTTLVEAGVIERKESGAVSFPYDAVRVDFTVQAA